MKVTVILPAAGLGTRMGRSSSEKPAAEKTGTSRKQFMLLEGSPILLHTVRKFAACDRITEIVVALRREDLDWVGELLTARDPQQAGARRRGRQQPPGIGGECPGRARSRYRPGGRSRRRPSVRDLETIEKALDEAAASGAAIVGIVPVDTVKQVTRAQTEHVHIRGTIPRDKLVLAQTPQVFRYDLLKRAFASAAEDGFIGTDESSLVERLEQEVSVVLGQRSQYQDHQALRHGPGEAVPGTGNGPERTGLSDDLYRTGLGWDVHRLVTRPAAHPRRRQDPFRFRLRRPLRCRCAHARHHRCPARRRRLGDIGQHFPDTDPRWKDAGSLQFLIAAKDMVRKQGYELVNIDSTVILERPKLKDYRYDIRDKISGVLGIDVEFVSVKFKTAERVGPVGEGKTTEAQAIVTIRKIQASSGEHTYHV